MRKGWYNIGVAGNVNQVTIYKTNMITIKVGHNTDPIRAIQKLKNKLIQEGLFAELKRRRFYAKPSLKKRLKREEAARQRVKDFRKAVARARKEDEQDNY